MDTYLPRMPSAGVHVALVVLKSAEALVYEVHTGLVVPLGGLEVEMVSLPTRISRIP